MTNFNWASDLSAMQEKLSGMGKFNSPFSDAALKYSDLTENALSKASSMLERAFAPQELAIDKVIDDINRMNTSLLYSSSIGHNPFEIMQTEKLSWMDKFVQPNETIASLNQMLERHRDLFEKQQSLSGIMAASFTNEYSLKKISSNLFNDNGKLTSAALFSGTTFLNTLKMYHEDEEAIAEAYNEAEAFLKEDPAIKEDIRTFFSTLKAYTTRRERRKNKRTSQSKNAAAKSIDEIQTQPEWKKLMGLHDLAEKFMNETLIRKYGLSHTRATLLMYVIAATLAMLGYVVDLAKDVYIEANGGELYNDALNIKNKPELAQPVKHDTLFVPIKQEETDFTIDRTSMFLKHSVKTKKIGSLDPNTNVLILKIKNGWCLVKGTATITMKNTRENRKFNSDSPGYVVKGNVIEIQDLVTGWVQKRHLDMFQ